MPPATFSSDELVQAAREYYASQRWRAPKQFTAAEKKRVGRLSRRPEFIAKHDGMEHFVYVTGKITDSTFRLFKQILFEIQQNHDFCHVVSVCAQKVPSAKERRLKAMGVGIILVRQDGDPLQLVHPRLTCFRGPRTYDRVPLRIRRHVKDALRQIVEGDVCVGVLDLAQALEHRLSQRGITVNTLGAKIQEAETAGLLSPLAAAAAKRVNPPRIVRAHPQSHAKRRAEIVSRVQDIVEDCLAVIFAIG